MKLFYKLKSKFSKRSFRFLWQRITRGWDDSETWSLDYSLAKIILPRLKRFQEVRGGHPSDMTDQEWEEIINEMIWVFEWYVAEGKWNSTSKTENERAWKALKLFGKYYSHLWW